MIRYIFIFKIIVVSQILLCAKIGHAQSGSIFIEKRSDGTVVYTDKPKDPLASVKLDLTPLARYTPGTSELLLSNGAKLDPNQQPASCYAHGGTDCAAGPDSDGSVICSDGFRAVRARYNFNCRQVKLAVNNAHYDPQLRQLKVLVRNNSQVAANNVVVYIKQKSNSKVVSNIIEKIEPFGAGDFLFNNIILLDNFRDKIVDNLVVSCDNCG